MAKKRGPMSEEQKARLRAGRQAKKERREQRYRFAVGQVVVQEYDYGFELHIGNKVAYYPNLERTFDASKLRDYLTLHATDAEKDGIAGERQRLGY